MYVHMRTTDPIPPFVLPCVLIAVSLGCTPAAQGRRGGGGTPESPAAEAALTAYCAITAHADLVAWEGDLVTRCEEAEHDEMRCVVERVGASGALEPAGIADPGEPVLRALGLARGYAALSLASGRLVLAQPDGALRTLAPQAADPGASEDGEQLAWIEPDASVEGAWELGMPTRVMMLGALEGEPVLVARDEAASSPRPVPGGDEVLWVSTASGVASFVVAAPGAPPDVLTNAGATEVGQDFVPVADARAAWSGGRLVYAADDAETGRSEILALDPIRGEVITIGPGDWPHPDGDTFLARQAGSIERCALRYAAGGAP